MAPQAKVKTPAELEAESNARRAEDSEAVLGAAEDGRLAPGATQPNNQGQNDDPLEGGVERREPIPRSPHDDIRGRISARFRRAEPEDERPFDGNFNNEENLYGDVAAEVQPSDDDDSAEELAALTGEDVDTVAQRTGAKKTGQSVPKPTTLNEDVGAEDDSAAIGQRMITRTVRGKQVTKTLDQWLDAASQVTAADSYLEESRALLRDAKALKAERSGQSSQHPGEANGTYDEELDGRTADETSAQHPEPTMRDVVQKLQYGDPEEAAAELERIIDARAGKQATEGALKRTFDQDLARSKKALADFSAANKELAADELAAIAIENGMYAGYRDDMLKLGLTEAQLPKTPQELANWHRFYRVNGYEVRSTSALLEASKERLLKWRGGQPNRQQPSRQQPKARIEVNVDRDARRMAIPSQPSRSSAPRRDAPAPVATAGSSVVAQMRAARGQT